MKKGHTIEIMERIFSGDADSNAMADLVRKFPTQNLRVVDLPYRFSSWSYDCPENIRRWTDEQGQVMAWAVLPWQRRISNE